MLTGHAAFGGVARLCSVDLTVTASDQSDHERPPGGHVRGTQMPYDHAAALGSGRDPERAVTGLYQAHAVGLIRLAMLMVGDAPSAEDVVQDAFIGLHRKWGTLRDPDDALTYVRSAVLNRCRSVLRRRAVAARFGHSFERPAWSAEESALAGEDRREVLTAIARLSPRQREVLALRYYCDLPEDQIARVLRVSRGTVSSTTSRALTALAALLGEQP